MPFFHNATETTLRFEIDDERYAVPPGAQCEIPRKFAWVPAARGLPLTAGAAPTEGAQTVEPTVVSPSRPVYPPGVEVGPVRDQDDDEDGSDEEPSGETSESVDSAVADLERQGVAVPGRSRRSRG